MHRFWYFRNGTRPDVFHGGLGKLAQRYQPGQEIQLGALGLMVNIVLWQTVYTQAALDHLANTGHHINPIDIAPTVTARTPHSDLAIRNVSWRAGACRRVWPGSASCMS